MIKKKPGEIANARCGERGHATLEGEGGMAYLRVVGHGDGRISGGTVCEDKDGDGADSRNAAWKWMKNYFSTGQVDKKSPFEIGGVVGSLRTLGHVPCSVSLPRSFIFSDVSSQHPDVSV
jgi:hypothetical protein